MVAPQPAGDGEPKPGGESKTMLVMPRVESSVTRGDQMALVSGTPWTKTLVLWGIRREYTYIEDGEVGDCLQMSIGGMLISASVCNCYTAQAYLLCTTPDASAFGFRPALPAGLCFTRHQVG